MKPFDETILRMITPDALRCDADARIRAFNNTTLADASAEQLMYALGIQLLKNAVDYTTDMASGHLAAGELEEYKVAVDLARIKDVAGTLMLESVVVDMGAEPTVSSALTAIFDELVELFPETVELNIKTRPLNG